MHGAYDYPFSNLLSLATSTLGTQPAQTQVNKKHWPAQWARPPPALLTDISTKAVNRGPSVLTQGEERLSVLRLWGSVCTGDAAFVLSHCSQLNGAQGPRK